MNGQLARMNDRPTRADAQCPPKIGSSPMLENGLEAAALNVIDVTQFRDTVPRHGRSVDSASRERERATVIPRWQEVTIRCH